MRCNVGIDPQMLTDQHLIAESVELKMVPGKMRHTIKMGQTLGEPLQTFMLGTGHMRFFYNKLAYLNERLQAVNSVMVQRGFKPGSPTMIDPFEFGQRYAGRFKPSTLDRVQICDRIEERLRLKPESFWRKDSKRLNNFELDQLINTMKRSSPFHL